MDTVLITGTTSGIGKAFAEKFAEAGDRVILVSRDGGKLRRQQAGLRAHFCVPVEAIPCDLAGPHAADLIQRELCARGLSVDILVNNAGFNEAGPFTDTSLSRELAMIQVHVRTLTALTKLVLPGMVQRGYGRILNLGSTGAYIPCPHDAVYAATKAYILSFSNGLYHELKGTGVTVTCLCPGATRTLFAGKADLQHTRLFNLFVMEPETVAAAGYDGLRKGKRVVTAGLYNKLLVLSARLLPVSVASPIAQWMVSS